MIKNADMAEDMQQARAWPQILGFGVEGLGLRVWGLGFRVWGFRVWGFRV